MRVVYVLSFILSACSLLYELLIAQTLTMIAGNMVVWYSLTVGIFLAAMGVGVILHGSLGWSRNWGRLYMVEIMLSLIGASAVILLNSAHTLYLFQMTRSTGDMSIFIFFSLWFTITFLIGILTGMELPLLIDLGKAVAAGTDVTNRVLGWDYIGALAGGVIFPLFLVPFLYLHTIGFLIAGLNLLVAFYLLRCLLPRSPWASVKTVGCAVFGTILVVATMAQAEIDQYFLQRYYYYQEASESLGQLIRPMHDMPFVYRENSPYQKIDIVHDPGHYDNFMEAYSTKFIEKPYQPTNRYLFLNGDFQLASNYEELYHEWFTHIPIIVNGKVPERVLVLGGGDGIIHRELLKYRGVKSIDHVDIDHRLVALAKAHPILSTINEGSLHDSRVHISFGDAFQYARNYNGKKYDAIYMDFPNALDYNVSKLYSREFYHFVRRCLANDGFAVLDAPEIETIQELDARNKVGSRPGGSWAIHSNTMRLAGFKTVIPYYSLLENDNPNAYGGVGDSADALIVEEETQELGTDSGVNYELEQGFIMLRKDERRGPFEYMDFGIKLHVLNELRFGLAFPHFPENKGPVDLTKVNSILRPTLPEGGIWYIRSAW